MKTDAETNETADSEGTINPDVVFNDDVLVVDYLNALLASAPALELDSGEVHYVQLAIGAGWKPTVVGNSFVDSSVFFETENLKMENETLHNENESYKFKVEMAKIDVQVLRSENHHLKAEIAALKSQQEQLKHTLDELAAENSVLKTEALPAVATNQPEPEITIIALSHPAPLVHEPSELTVDAEGEVVQASQPERNLPDIREEPVDIIPFEMVQEIPFEAEIVAPSPRLPESTFSAEAERSTMFQAHITEEPAPLKVRTEQVLSSRNIFGSVISTPSTMHASKVVKQHQIDQYQRRHEPDQTVKTTPLIPDSSVDHISKKAEWQPVFAQPLQVAEPEIVPEENAVLQQDLQQHRDSTDEIDLAPAQAPQVVVRRHMKDYQDLQKEADPDNTAVTGHTLVL